MKTYLVGGAVRDKLLGLAPGDRDWVVGGATQVQMEAEGFKSVGRDLTVFLHPRTGEEYALARTERKSGRGYRGFVVDADPSVTLQEDLQRRDFTLNAIAQADDGTLIPVRNVGLTNSRVPGAKQRYLRTIPSFEAPEGRHGWLNQAVFVGTIGTPPADAPKPAVVIRVYRVT